MAGTKAGGKQAAKTNKELYGSDFYKQIGAKGGSVSNTGGFHVNRDLARIAGAKGGKMRKGRKYPRMKLEDRVTQAAATQEDDRYKVPYAHRVLRPINGEADILVPIKRSLFSKLFRRNV